MSEKWTTAQMPSQAGRTAIVTGANSGLGLETTAALAASGARVIMACRNPAKAAAALETVRRRAPQADVALMTLDLASLASVRSFAAEFRRRHDTLDLLINNAGILGVPLTRTVDGFENQMATNHLGHFALTGLLMPQLRTTPGARVVVVSSLAHRSGAHRLHDPNWERSRYSPAAAYGWSKLANLMFALELQRRLDAAGTWPLDALGPWLSPPIRNTRSEATGAWDVSGALQYS